jgi:hypothetical protein
VTIYTQAPSPAELGDILDTVFGWLDEHGHADAFPAAREHRAHARSIRSDASAQLVDPHEVRSRVVHELLDGEVGIVDAAHAHDAARHEAGLGPDARQLVDSAANVADAAAWAAVDPEQLVELLAAVVEAAAAELRKARPLDVSTDAQAIQAGPKVAASWARLTAAAATIEATQTLYVDAVVCNRLVPGVGWADELDVAWLLYAKPSELTSHWQSPAVQAHPVVLAVEQLDAQPTCVPPAVARQRQADADSDAPRGPIRTGSGVW